ncbi:MAG TPA: type II toxin-antitoxin system VapC family toxin [Candidatus Margulisiibacteriota bacterium]|nr:type II toxin-antitoxin system VapC family toxin [Candidatus Margulisiibacteriota bacterium]
MAELTLLVDSDVLIDFFRGSSQAAGWVSANRNEVIGIPVIVLMELLQGARSTAEQASIRERLEMFAVQHLETGDSQRALEWFAAHRLSHGTGIMDCLIAAIAARLSVPFYTFNVRHFGPLAGVDARMPYARPEATTR